VRRYTNPEDWEQNWRVIAPDDCTICMGTGTDQIKGNKDKPCGGCYGLGKVLASGERPADLWELATVANGIIERHQAKLTKQRQQLAMPEVKEALLAAEMQRITDSVARQEQQWRDGKGHGPGGQRYTGD